MKTEAGDVLIVDDEPGMRHMLRVVLEKEGYGVEEACDGSEALARISERTFAHVLCDIRMPAMDGMAFLREAFARECPANIIMMSAYGTLDAAIACMKLGAYDFISKPFKKDEVVLTLRKAEERLRLIRENQALREKLSLREEKRLVFQSPAMAAVADLVRRAAEAPASVLITGETGTGKELVARALHAASRRSPFPFLAVNCGAIPSALFESELFGHRRGAFTGAGADHVGLFGAADGGILFLDEIADLPLDLQPKLLRVLQEGEIRRVGEAHSRRVNVRVLAATSRNLKEEVASGRFREDLFYRLAVIEVRLPPLRERREDIPGLASHFLELLAGREGRPAPTIEPKAMRVLQEYGWPGNVRELENFLQKALIFCRGDRIDLASLPWEIRRRERSSELSLPAATGRLEREYIRKALASTGGNRTRAARLLEISLRGLLYKMKEYGIE